MNWQPNTHERINTCASLYGNLQVFLHCSMLTEEQALAIINSGGQLQLDGQRAVLRGLNERTDLGLKQEISNSYFDEEGLQEFQIDGTKQLKIAKYLFLSAMKEEGEWNSLLELYFNEGVKSEDPNKTWTWKGKGTMSEYDYRLRLKHALMGALLMQEAYRCISHLEAVLLGQPQADDATNLASHKMLNARVDLLLQDVQGNKQRMANVVNACRALEAIRDKIKKHYTPSNNQKAQVLLTDIEDRLDLSGPVRTTWEIEQQNEQNFQETSEGYQVLARVVPTPEKKRKKRKAVSDEPPPKSEKRAKTRHTHEPTKLPHPPRSSTQEAGARPNQDLKKLMNKFFYDLISTVDPDSPDSMMNWINRTDSFFTETLIPAVGNLPSTGSTAVETIALTKTFHSALILALNARNHRGETPPSDRFPLANMTSEINRRASGPTPLRTETIQNPTPLSSPMSVGSAPADSTPTTRATPIATTAPKTPPISINTQSAGAARNGITKVPTTAETLESVLALAPRSVLLRYIKTKCSEEFLKYSIITHAIQQHPEEQDWDAFRLYKEPFVITRKADRKANKGWKWSIRSSDLSFRSQKKPKSIKIFVGDELEKLNLQAWDMHVATCVDEPLVLVILQGKEDNAQFACVSLKSFSSKIEKEEMVWLQLDNSRLCQNQEAIQSWLSRQGYTRNQIFERA